MRKTLRLVSCLFVLSLSVSWVSFAEQNLVKNPSFEDVVGNRAAEWAARSYFEDTGVSDYIIETGAAHSGNHSFTIRNNSLNDGRIFQFVNVKPNTVYRLSGWIKTDNLQGDAGASITVFDSFAGTTALNNTGGSWQYMEVYGLTGEYQVRMPVGFRIGSWFGKVMGSASFDDISLVQIKNRNEVKGNIDSFSFIDPYSEEKATKYFERQSDPRFSGNTILMSLFLAILLFVAAISFTAYNIFLKGKNKKLETLLTVTFGKYFYIFVALLFVVFFLVYSGEPSRVTMMDIQAFFIISVIAACAVAGYLYKTGQLTVRNLAKLVLALGVMLRLAYFLYTDVYTRQHDLWGGWSHTAYIEWMAAHFTLPPVGTYEAYHPPVHYFLSAIVFDTVKLFTKDTTMSFRGVQLLMTFFSMLTLVFYYKIFRILKIDDKVMLVGVALACFLPNLIYMSPALNNDPTVLLFYTICFYYLLKWIDEKTIKNTVLFAIFTALAVLSKKFSLIMFPIAGIVFVVELIKNRSEYKKLLIQGAIFVAIALPLGMSFQIRNYLEFGQDLSYAVPAFGNIMSGNPYNLFFVDAGKLLSQPISSPVPDQRSFFLMEMIRTALFEVFQYPGLNDMAAIVMFFALLNMVVFVLYFILFRKQDWGDKTYIFLINMIGVILLYMNMRSTQAYDCTYAFRYISPYLYISIGYFIGHAVTRFSSMTFPVFKTRSTLQRSKSVVLERENRYPILGYVVQAQFWLWCIAVAVFICMVGFTE